MCFFFSCDAAIAHQSSISQSNQGTIVTELAQDILSGMHWSLFINNWISNNYKKSILFYKL